MDVLFFLSICRHKQKYPEFSGEEVAILVYYLQPRGSEACHLQFEARTELVPERLANVAVTHCHSAEFTVPQPE